MPRAFVYLAISPWWEKTVICAYTLPSYLDNIGIKNFSSVIKEDFLLQFFEKDPEKYEAFVLDWTEEDYNRLREAKLLLD